MEGALIVPIYNCSSVLVQGQQKSQAGYGDDSNAVLGQLKNVQQIQYSGGSCLAILGHVSVVPWGAAGDGDCTAVAAVGRPVCSCGSSSFYAAHHGRDGSLVFSLRT